jgi:dihydroorotase
MLVDNEETLAGIFRDAPTVIATHCESTPRIEKRLALAIEKYGENIPVTEHPWIRDEQSCLESSRLAVELARTHEAQLHILHLSTAAETELFEPGPVEQQSITGEVCVHFLEFTSEDYPAMGNRIKCNPSIKAPEHQAALLAALADGRINILATDHAPHTAEEKAEENYLKAPAGLPLVQDVLLCALEQVHRKRLSLERVVALTSHNVARRFGVIDRGFVREGYWADLALVDLERPTEVTSKRIRYHCGWSPFEGRRFTSSVLATWVNGTLAFKDGELFEHGAARRLDFDQRR